MYIYLYIYIYTVLMHHKLTTRNIELFGEMSFKLAKSWCYKRYQFFIDTRIANYLSAM